MATAEKKPAQDEKQQQNGEVDTAAETSEQLGIDAPDSTPFSLELSQDQKDIRDWVHGFAERRRAPGRARVGRARGDPLADHPGGREDRPLRLRGRSRSSGPTRPASPSRSSTRSSSGATPASACRSWARRWPSRASTRSGTPEQLVEWVPQCFGTADDVEGRRVLLLRARRRLRRLGASAPAPSTTRPRTSGSSTARRPGPPTAASPTSTSSSPRSTASSGSRGHAGLRHPARARRASSRAPRSRSTASAPRTPPTSSSTTAASPARCLLGGKEKLDERLARAREGKSSQGPGRDGDLRGLAPDRRRAGGRHRPRRLRVRARLRQGARAVRPADHREPGDRLHARRHEDGDRRRPPARLARRLDGPHRQATSTPPRARCRS